MTKKRQNNGTRDQMFASHQKGHDFNVVELTKKAKARLVYRTQVDAVEQIFEVIRNNPPISDPASLAEFTASVEKDMREILGDPENYFAPFVGWVCSITTDREDRAPTERWLVTYENTSIPCGFVDEPSLAMIFPDPQTPLALLKGVLNKPPRELAGMLYPAVELAIAMNLTSEAGVVEGVIHIRPVLVGPSIVNQSFVVVSKPVSTDALHAKHNPEK